MIRLVPVTEFLGHAASEPLTSIVLLSAQFVIRPEKNVVPCYRRLCQDPSRMSIDLLDLAEGHRLDGSNVEDIEVAG